MYFYELLKEINIEKVADYIYDHFEEEGFFPDKETSRKVYATFRQDLLACTPNKDDNSILIGFTASDRLLITSSEAAPVSVNVLHINEIKENSDYVYQLLEEKEEEQMTDEEITDVLLRFPSNDAVRGCCFEFTKWEDILGWTVDKKNVKKLGEEAFVGYVLNEMSFNGFTRESQEERRNDLESTIEKYDLIMQLPKEERDKHFVSAEETFKKLGIKDERTEEEKEDFARKVSRDTYKTLRNELKMIAGVMQNI